MLQLSFAGDDPEGWTQEEIGDEVFMHNREIDSEKYSVQTKKSICTRKPSIEVYNLKVL